MRWYDRVFAYLLLTWAMVLASVVVLHNYPDMRQKIDDMHRWCQNSLAPAEEKQKGVK